MKVLYAVSESAPFVKTGGLADVAGSLPEALCRQGVDARVIMPLYGSIAQKWRDKMSFCFYTYVKLSWRSIYCGVFSLEHKGVTYYFVDNESYFKREGVYGFYDDGERFGYFCRAVIEITPLLNWKPDLINCNDWQTALIPIYLKQEPSDYYRSIRTVFTIHNIEYQGRFGENTLEDLFGLSQELFENGIIRFNNDVDLMKGAIYQSDFVTTVSPSYCLELRDPYFGCGLHNVVNDNRYKFAGILNGLDTDRYNPENDETIPANFSADDLSGKTLCRKELCQTLGFDENDTGPILSCVSRLVTHKGFDLVADALESIISKNVRLVILGTGDSGFEQLFRDAEMRYPGRVSANIMYSEQRAMLVYSGSDMLLMPSRSEPCGLSQMIAMRYGTIPIVRCVGGLRDSVRNYRTENSNGFTFGEYTPSAMLGAIDDALNTFGDSTEWSSLMDRAMREDLSWETSAGEYIKIYTKLLK